MMGLSDRTNTGSWKRLAGIGLALLGAGSPAMGGQFSFAWTLRSAPVWVPPVYETRARTIVESAVHEDRPTRIWHEPIYEERNVRVEIPAEYATRRVPIHDRWGRCTGYRLIKEIVRPARSVFKTERVLVRPGYYETVIEHVCVRPERSRVIYEEILVTPGHWTYPSLTVRAGESERLGYTRVRR